MVFRCHLNALHLLIFCAQLFLIFQPCSWPPLLFQQRKLSCFSSASVNMESYIFLGFHVIIFRSKSARAHFPHDSWWIIDGCSRLIDGFAEWSQNGRPFSSELTPVVSYERAVRFLLLAVITAAHRLKHGHGTFFHHWTSLMPSEEF